MIDFDNVRELALEHRPKMILAGATAYSRLIDPAPFREIADEIGALLMFDSAHVAGLIAGGSHPNPVPYADVVAFTTHKTLRVRGGAILCREEYAKKIDSAVFPVNRATARTRDRRQGRLVQGGRVAEFRDVHRADRREREGLRRRAREGGLPQRLGGTENHMVLLDLREFDEELTGKLAQEVLDRAGITTNRNTIPTTRAVRSSRRDSAWQRRANDGRHERGGVRNDRDVDVARAAPPRRRRDRHRGARRRRGDVRDVQPYANFTKQ